MSALTNSISAPVFSYESKVNDRSERMICVSVLQCCTRRRYKNSEFFSEGVSAISVRSHDINAPPSLSLLSRLA
jgi:hypothetical protein